jgi:hypothetical protein
LFILAVIFYRLGASAGARGMSINRLYLSLADFLRNLPNADEGCDTISRIVEPKLRCKNMFNFKGIFFSLEGSDFRSFFSVVLIISLKPIAQRHSHE